MSWHCCQGKTDGGEKGDGTCEVPINLRSIPVNKPSVAANKQKDD